MLTYSLKRLLQSLVTVFVVVTLVFLLMRLLPVEGYFADGYDKLTPEQLSLIHIFFEGNGVSEHSLRFVWIHGHNGSHSVKAMEY